MTDSSQDGARHAGDAARWRAGRRRLRQLSTFGAALQDDQRWLPAWSSLALEQAVAKIQSEPGGDVGDVLHALWELLGTSNAVLDTLMANFIRDVVKVCFTRDRTRYATLDHAWMVRALGDRPTAAQAYLALSGLPEPQLSKSRNDLLAGLAESDFFAEAQNSFSSAPPSDP